MRNSDRTRHLLWFLLLALIGFIAFTPGLHGKYFGDDFVYILDSPSSEILPAFVHRVPHNAWYRPILVSFLATVQTFFGLNPFPVHLVYLLLHILFCWLIYRGAQWLGLSRLQGSIASLYMLVCQSNAYPVSAIDTLSQIGGSLFGCLTLWFLHRAYIDGSGQDVGTRPLPITRWGYYLCCLPFYILALISKESNVSFAALAVGLVLIKNVDLRQRTFPLRKISVEAFPFVLLLVLYMAGRAMMGAASPTMGSEPYEFALGFNIIRNLVQFLVATVIPGSSVTLFAALQTRDLLGLAVPLAGALLLTVAVVYGLWRSNRRGLIWVLGAFALVNLFPAAALNHVSELYLYNSLPFFSLLIGIGLGCLWELIREKRVWRLAAATAFSILIISHILALRSKTAMMAFNGDRAEHWLAQIDRFYSQIPPDGKLYLVNPPPREISYSVFSINGFSVLNYGLPRLAQLSRRNDFYAYVVEHDAVDTLPVERSLFLGIADDTVYSLQRDPQR